MPLADYNVQEFVTEQVNVYLQDNKFTFSELKTLILSKSLISELHSQMVVILTQAKQQDQAEVKKKLETQANKKQLEEDKRQIKEEHAAALKDEESKEHLNAELKDNSSQLNANENELFQLKIQLARLIETESRQGQVHQYEQAHQHGHEHQREHSHHLKPSLTTQDESKAAIAQVNRDIEQCNFKIRALLIQKIDIQKSIGDIETRAKKRLVLQLERNSREQARIGYETTKGGLRDALSTENWTQLSTNIQKQHRALEIKCAELIKAIEEINYMLFLTQLPRHLEHFSLQLTEIDALKTILKLIKQNIQHEQEAKDTSDSLNKQKALIAEHYGKLRGFKAKITALHQDNPSLTANNERLIQRNSELVTSLEQNTNSRQSYATPTLLLFALTFLLTIPLILLLSGVIPFFAAPVLVFTLFITPPAALFIGTLITGISSAVYACKACTDQNEMDTNQQIIENNKSQMNRNTQELRTLQTTTIPELEMHIKSEELIRDRLVEPLARAELLSQQTLVQAQKIEPISITYGSFLTHDKKTAPSSPLDSSILEEELPKLSVVF